MWGRLLAIIRKEFLQIFRDLRTVTIILVIPILQLFLLGYAATNDVKNVPLAVLDRSRSAESRALVEAFNAANYFRVAYQVYSEAELQQLIERGEVRAGLIIPPDYAARLLKGDAQVAIILDGSDPTIGSTALSTAQLIGQHQATKVLEQKLASLGRSAMLKPPLEVRPRVWYNPDLVSAYFMIPGVIGMILYAITSVLTATAIVRERERGTIEQLIVTPIRSWELVVGKILPYVLLAFFDTLEVLAIGHLWFGVPVRGSLMLLLALSGLLLLSGLGIGLLASTIANTQQEAMLSVWMTLLPGIFLSGFFFPIEAMPKVLQWISYLIPLRYYLVIIRAILIKGAGIAVLQRETLALGLLGILLMGAAAFRFRKRLD
ncbi:MAG: ABC transporter permease [Anaerolineales bacterium]